MLRSLSVRNIVLIDRLDLEFAPGLTALTGETGAGKSIILDALGLASGARGDKALVRAGADQGSAAAGFAVADGHPALPAMAEAGFEAAPAFPEAREILLRRTLGADGRSRAFINDEAASVALLGALGETLIEVHGQHDGRGLLDARTHRGLLDAAGGHDGAVRAVRAAFAAMAETRAARDAALAAHAAAEADREFLRHAVEELERLDPRAGEEAALAEQRAFLSTAEKSLTDLQDAAGALAGDGGLEDRLATALASLERILAKLPEAGAEDGPRAVVARAAAALERALIEAGEARAAVDDAARRFEVEPGRLEKVEERLFALRAAARKHQTDVATLPDLRRALTERLDGIEARGAHLTQAEGAVAKAEKSYDAAATALTKARLKAAKTLDAAVAAELPPLKLDKARFRTSCEPSGRDSAEGRDRVRFEVATNPGAPFGALDEIASGGELSRFGLAIKVSLTAGEGGMTLIFDEVDQGVGGAVADAVGRRLKSLSAANQVLVVTHSPQVAARADHHFLIEKNEDGKGVVTTHVRPLDAAAREEELARMLAGATVTEEARAAARKLRAADT